MTHRNLNEYEREAMNVKAPSCVHKHRVCAVDVTSTEIRDSFIIPTDHVDHSHGLHGETTPDGERDTEQ